MLTSRPKRAIRLLLDRTTFRGFCIEAVPSFNLDAAAWKARALVWKDDASTLCEPVEDPSGGAFLSRADAVHASLFLGRRWAARQSRVVRPKTSPRRRSEP